MCHRHAASAPDAQTADTHAGTVCHAGDACAPQSAEAFAAAAAHRLSPQSELKPTRSHQEKQVSTNIFPLDQRDGLAVQYFEIRQQRQRVIAVTRMRGYGVAF